jgi:hypothetical protein
VAERRHPDYASGMLTLAEARRLALSFAEVTEEDHHGIPSFRVLGKIFATVPDDAHVRVMLDPDTARLVVRGDSGACEELWWGKTLSGVCVRLARADHARFAALLEDAWRRKAPKRLQLGRYDDDAPGSAGKRPTRRSSTGRTGASGKTAGSRGSARRGTPGR